MFETTDADAALEELLYKDGGADDTGAVEKAFTYCITMANVKKFSGMDVVFISDRGPMQNSAVASAKLWDKHRKNAKSGRVEDKLYFVNIEPTGFERRNGDWEPDFTDMSLNSDLARTGAKYLRAYNKDSAIGSARVIVENYGR